MTTDPSRFPPAGWYPDPADAEAQRWWGGSSWTTHVVYPQGVAPNERPSRVANSVVGPPTGGWGLPDIVWAILLFVGASVVGGGLLLAANPDVFSGTVISYDTPTKAWAAVVAQGLSMAGLVGWALIVARWKGDGWRRSFGFVVNGRAWLIGGLGGIATLVVMAALTALMDAMTGKTIDSAAADLVSQLSDVPLAYVVFLLFIAFGAPFVEEIALRGLVWGAIAKRGWSPWLATSVSAVLFGLMHAEPLRLLPLAAGGFVLGVIRHYAGLGASMFSHSIVNTIGVVAILLSA